MAERGAGQRSWPLSPYEVNVSFANIGAAGEAANWFGPLDPITPLAPPRLLDGNGIIHPAIIFRRSHVPMSRLPFRRCAGSRTVTIFCVSSSRRERIKPHVNRGASWHGINPRAQQWIQRESQHY